jgi:hypothetical protein
MSAQRGERGGLVGHHALIADDIGGQNGRESPVRNPRSPMAELAEEIG